MPNNNPSGARWTPTLAALRDCMETEESWVMASTVALRLGSSQATVVGRELSRLAQAGDCERAWSSSRASWCYRVGLLPPRPVGPGRPMGSFLVPKRNS